MLMLSSRERKHSAQATPRIKIPRILVPKVRNIPTDLNSSIVYPTPKERREHHIRDRLRGSASSRSCGHFKLGSSGFTNTGTSRFSACDSESSTVGVDVESSLVLILSSGKDRVAGELLLIAAFRLANAALMLL